MKKESWETPQLTIIRRTSTTESVLLFCKGVGSSGMSGAYFGGCFAEYGMQSCNARCDNLSLS